MHPQFTPSQIARFWKRVDRRDDASCWEWQGNRMRLGYGRYGQTLAHRISYMLTHGDLSDEECVLHRCDNPPCVNPHHLSKGSRADNAADRHRKGRTRPGIVRGSRNGMAKLSESDVLAIKKMVQTGAMTGRAIATHFGVSPSTISVIVRGRAWRHLDPASS